MNNLVKKSRASSLSIDDLPSDFTHDVLVRLPIRDAVRTSILSSQWRYRWTTMAHLQFRYDANHTNSELSDIVDRVLMLHVGPIRTFKLYTNLITPSKLDHWSISLTRNHVETLALDLSQDVNNYYSVHSSVFYCQSIRSLDLRGCDVKLPRLFGGFTNLSSLVLHNVAVSEGDLRSVISRCPLLQKLELVGIQGCDLFEISSPSLRCLFFEGEFTDFCIVSAPALSELYIALSQPEDDSSQTHEGVGNLRKILACANSIERLDLQLYVLEFLSVGCEAEKLPVVFERLRSLRLNVCFADLQEASLLLSLLRSSPYLRDLNVYGGGFNDVEEENNNIWEVGEDVDVFCHLRFVKIIDFCCVRPEMEFIKYVLGHAPVLQKMEISIDPKSNASREEVFIELMRFRRASTQAEIIYIRN